MKRPTLTLLALLVLGCDATPPPRTSDCPPPPAPTAAAPEADIESERRACTEGDAEICERLFARHLTGAGAAEDPERARGYQKRALELRLAACARGDKPSCGHLPDAMIPMALDPTVSANLPANEPESVKLVISIDSSGSTFVGGSRVEGDLIDHLEAICKNGTRAVVNADARVSHGRVIEAVDALKQAGCTRIAFAVTPKAE